MSKLALQPKKPFLLNEHSEIFTQRVKQSRREVSHSPHMPSCCGKRQLHLLSHQWQICSVHAKGETYFKFYNRLSDTVAPAFVATLKIYTQMLEQPPPQTPWQRPCKSLSMHHSQLSFTIKFRKIQEPVRMENYKKQTQSAYGLFCITITFLHLM
jgi:hypothetical protein